MIGVTPPLEVIERFIGNVARPFAIWGTAATTAWAIVDPGVGADKLTAAGLILCALYGAKVYENRVQTKATAEVEIAKVAAAPQAETAEPAGEGLDAPPWERAS